MGLVSNAEHDWKGASYGRLTYKCGLQKLFLSCNGLPIASVLSEPCQSFAARFLDMMVHFRPRFCLDHPLYSPRKTSTKFLKIFWIFNLLNTHLMESIENYSIYYVM